MTDSGPVADCCRTLQKWFANPLDHHLLPTSNFSLQRLASLGLAWLGLAWLGLGLAWLGLGLAWLGLAWLGLGLAWLDLT